MTNKLSQKWLGRNRPATGAGATANVGATAQPPAAQVIPQGQSQMPSSVAANSFNPHAASPNYVFAHDSVEVDAHDGAHAPANKSFNGIGIAPVSAFR